MFEQRTTNRFEARAKTYAKKHKNELNAVINNLARLERLLNEGKPLRPPPCGFLKDEGGGVMRISEAGGGGNLAATRLYIYVVEVAEVIYLLSLGDKNTQQEDITECKDLVRQIRGRPKPGG